MENLKSLPKYYFGYILILNNLFFRENSVWFINSLVDIVNRLYRKSDVFLLAFVLNINVLRFFLNVDDTSVSLYGLYILCLCFLYCKNFKRVLHAYKKNRFIKIYIVYWLFIIVYSLITGILFNDELFLFFKYLMAILIGLLCLEYDSKKICYVLKYYIIINIIYGIDILMNPEKVLSYMSGSVNYLNMTLTLGLCLTVYFSKLVGDFYDGINKNLYLDIALIIFFFIVIMKFPARGVLIFPPLIAIFYALINSNGHKLKFISFLLFLIVMLIGAFIYFMQNASEYAMIHMTGLFENTEGESRIEVWTTSVNAIFNTYWLFIGAGLGGFENAIGFYPHNIFLQMWSDFGFLAFLFFSIIMTCIIVRMKSASLHQSKPIYIRTSQLCYVGFLYYLLTFCKSFSMYDSCPLLIMTSFCISFIHYKTK